MFFYLDNAATTPLNPCVLEAMIEQMQNHFGNPSSVHLLGLEAEKILKESRKTMASLFSRKPSSVFFTSGATEANNWAIENTWQSRHRRGSVFLADETSHASVLTKLSALKQQGAKTILVPVDENGIPDLDFLEKNLSEEVIFFSGLWVNNETGVLSPLKKMVSLIRKHSPHCLIHCDAVQGFQKLETPGYFSELDYISVSAHKIHGPKGAGALIIRDNLPLVPLLHGGGQENGKRGGTENVTGILGMARAALEMNSKINTNQILIAALQQCFEKIVKANIKDLLINGSQAPRSPYITSLSIKGIRGEVLVHALEKKGIILSTGAACSSKKDPYSQVLKAMKIEKAFLDGSVRVSYSDLISEEDIKKIAEQFAETVHDLRKEIEK